MQNIEMSILQRLNDLELRFKELDELENQLLSTYRQKRKELVFLMKHTKVQKFKAKNLGYQLYSPAFYNEFITEFKQKITAGDTEYQFDDSIISGCRRAISTQMNILWQQLQDLLHTDDLSI